MVRYYYHKTNNFSSNFLQRKDGSKIWKHVCLFKKKENFMNFFFFVIEENSTYKDKRFLGDLKT